MAKLMDYRVIFKTPDETYYSRLIPQQCTCNQDAEYHSRSVKPKTPGDQYVTVECSEEEEFL